MKNIVRIAAPLLIATLLIGCASGPQYKGPSTVKPDEGTLYIYRTSDYGSSSGMTPTVYINDREYPQLRLGGYQVYNLPPGEYQVALDGNFFVFPIEKLVYAIELKAGETRYLRFGNAMGFLMSVLTSTRKAYFGEVEAEIAEKELAETKLSN